MRNFTLQAYIVNKQKKGKAFIYEFILKFWLKRKYFENVGI